MLVAELVAETILALKVVGVDCSDKKVGSGDDIAADGVGVGFGGGRVGCRDVTGPEDFEGELW